MNERPDYVGTSYRHADAWSNDAFGRGVPMATYYRGPHEREKGGLWSTIKSNPVPAALTAAALGWLWSNRASGSQSSQGSSYPSYSYNRSQTDSNWRSGSSYGESSRQGQPVGEQVANQAQQMGGQVQGAAGQVVGQAQQMGGQVQDAAGQVVGQVQNVAGQVQHQVQERAGQMQQQAQGIWQMVEANPTVTGALGAVLGGVTALLLPETEKENQLLGETRDRVVSTVQEKAEDTVARVQAVAEEAGQAAMGELSSQPQDSGSGKNEGSGSGSKTSST